VISWNEGDGRAGQRNSSEPVEAFIVRVRLDALDVEHTMQPIEHIERDRIGASRTVPGWSRVRTSTLLGACAAPVHHP
jgi:hypothetical protein